MRLNDTQARITKDTINRLLGAPSRVWLFGSRIHDDLRGGDIDLLIETDMILPNRAEILCRIYGALILALGDRKLDIILKDGRTRDALIFKIARRTGILL